MTQGLSPKVKRPALLLFCIGLGLLVLGIIISAQDVRTVGLTAIGSSLAALGVGYAAPPGEVTTTTPDPSDDGLSPEAVKQIEAAPAVEPDIELDQPVEPLSRQADPAP